MAKNGCFFTPYVIATLTLVVAVSTLSAQTVMHTDSLSGNVFGWSQAEREFGFAHLDEIFPTHEVSGGKKIHELGKGAPLAGFVAGGSNKEKLERFISEQKVAGLLVLQNGKIRMEEYAFGFGEGERWTSQSVAKSVTSTLVGIAINDGYIKSVEDYVVQYVPALKGSAYDSVTIRQLLTMTSGVRWTENYADDSSDIVKMYREQPDAGVDQTVSYMRRLTADAKPGKKWVYKTGDTHLLGVLVSSATGQSLSGYLSSSIWIPYGMESKATWNISSTDQELAGCCLQMTLRDFGRFGQFILDGARINGKSIVPDNWLLEATHKQIRVWPGWGYGYQWWTQDDGTFNALGIHGQMIHIDNARQLVVVVNSAWPEAESFPRQMVAANFLKLIELEIDKEAAIHAK